MGASSSQPADEEAAVPAPRKRSVQRHFKDEALGHRVHAFEQRRPSFKDDDWEWGANMLHSLDRAKTSKNLLAQSKLRSTPGGNRRMLPARHATRPPPSNHDPTLATQLAHLVTPPATSPVTRTGGAPWPNPARPAHR